MAVQLTIVHSNGQSSTDVADDTEKHSRDFDEEIDDRSATFIGEFYRELGTGKAYYQAFERGRTQIESDFDVPSFISRDRTIFDLPTNMREQTISLANVEDASYSQDGMISHMFNYGLLRLSTQGAETTYRFHYASNPKLQIATLNNAVEDFKNLRPMHH